MCDGMFVDCPFRAQGNFVSMDDPISGTDGLTRGDFIPTSEDYSVEYVVIKHFLQERIAAIFSGCTITEQQILRGIALDKSRHDLAKKLHMPRTTLSHYTVKTSTLDTQPQKTSSVNTQQGKASTCTLEGHAI